MTTATSGPTSARPFACYDPASRSWKTYPDIGLWGSIEFSGTWPKTGCMSHGLASELPTSGAAHRRERLFIAVTPDPNDAGFRGFGRLVAKRRDSDRRSRENGSRAESQSAPRCPIGANPACVSERQLCTFPSCMNGLPTTLLPTPAVNDMGVGKTVEQWDAWTDRMKSEHGNGNGHGKSLSIEAQRLLQTPSVSDAAGGHESRGGIRSGELLLKGEAKVMHGRRWGVYADAVARWESLTRPAPDPTELGPKGAVRLSSRFDEWHMGLPDGWVTDVPGVTWREALSLCGNGVVPQQAEAALRFLLPALERVA